MVVVTGVQRDFVLTSRIKVKQVKHGKVFQSLEGSEAGSREEEDGGIQERQGQEGDPPEVSARNRTPTFVPPREGVAKNDVFAF